MKYVSKTGRQRGLIYAQIRGFAARCGRPFTRYAFNLPPTAINSYLHILWKSGELLLVRPGRVGHNRARPPVYRFNPHFRPTRLRYLFCDHCGDATRHRGNTCLKCLPLC